MRYIPTTAVVKTCVHCGNEYRGMPSEMARRLYCSKECVSLSRKGKRKAPWATMNCAVCGKSFEVPQAWVKKGRRRYCSKECRQKAHPVPSHLGLAHTEESRQKMRDLATGRFLMQNSSQWKGGCYESNGYIHVMVATRTPEEQLLATQMGAGRYILEHRLVAATKTGRPLEKDETVHHLNGIKDDNRPENLLVITRTKHSISHRAVERELLALRERVSELEAENHALRSQIGQSPKAGEVTSPL